MAAESVFINAAANVGLNFPSSTRNSSSVSRGTKLGFIFTTRGSSRSVDGKNQVYKQLGYYSVKKIIQDTVARAEMLAPALELEHASCVKQEEMIRECNLWDDPVKSNEILGKFGDSVKVVDSLKDLTYKLEEAKLISELAEREAVNYQLFEQAYSASIAISKFLYRYELSKLLKGRYDLDGACLIIQAGAEGIDSEIWAEELLSMYMKWAEKLGYEGRLVEKHSGLNGGIRSATIEFEIEYAYGNLSGERGIHRKIISPSGTGHHQVTSACVDVVPLFLGTVTDVHISDDDLIVSSSLQSKEENLTEPTMLLQHIATGITVQSSGERSSFANKIKALNRLKAKLVVIAEEQKVTDVSKIRIEEIWDVWKNETRRYIYHPSKLVQDLKSGIQLANLNSVLDGNIEPLIEAHIQIRHDNYDCIA